MLEQRKRLLASEGLFDESRKKPLPIFPKTVGVVTSSTGAALRDIMQIIRRRNPTTGITIFPAIVQGSDAAASIAKQIEVANRFNMCDVLIVGRGGGSLEDLLPFSEEIVVRAVSNSKIPVISAVGHEIDFTIADFVADKRAPTPTGAAEMAVPSLEDVKNILDLGTGNAPIPMILSTLTETANIYGIEINENSIIFKDTIIQSLNKEIIDKFDFKLVI